MYRCGDYKWQTKNVLIEWKKPLEKDIDIFANSSLSLYVSIFRMELRWYCQLKTKTFFLSFEKYVKYEQENTYQHWWNEHTNSFKFSWWFSQKKQQQHVSYATIGKWWQFIQITFIINFLANSKVLDTSTRGERGVLKHCIVLQHGGKMLKKIR